MGRTHGRVVGRGAVWYAAPLVLFCALFACPGEAAAGVAGSRHDFSGKTISSGAGVCGPCHRPHYAPDALGLWKRSLGDERGYYAQSSDPNYIPGATVLCYDCHDDMITVVDRDPPATTWSVGYTPQDIALGGTNAGQPLVGYYEEADGTVPTGVGSAPPPAPTDGSPTGGHWWKSEPSDEGAVRERGDKIACSLCHDPHNAATGGNEAFFRSRTWDGAGWQTLDSYPLPLEASTYSAVALPNGSRHGTGTGREMCATCHGYSASGSQRTFFSVQVPQPTTAVPEHLETDTVTPCVLCHPHNRPAGCNDCHGYPPMVATPFDRVANPDGQSYAGGAGAHQRHRDALGPAVFECEICHGPNPGTIMTTWHAAGGATVQQGNVDIMGKTSYWGAGSGYVGQGSGEDVPADYAFAAKGGGDQRCFGLDCHGDPPNTPGALNWTDDMVDDVTGLAVGDGLNICKWCHDITPASIGAGPVAPNVLGDNNGASSSWSGGAWGADVNGHGLASGNYEKDLVDEATRTGVPAANKQCAVCHDARYTTLALPDVNTPVKTHFGGTSKRLRDTINGVATIADDPDNACAACHQNEGGTDSASEDGQVGMHGNAPDGGYKKWEPDLFTRSCRQCHEPHGANWNGVDPTPRNLHMLGKWVDVNGNGQPDGGALGPEAARVDSNATDSVANIDTNDLPVILKSAGGAGALADNSWDDGNNDGVTPPDSLCVVCHVSLVNDHSQVGDSVPQGSGHLTVGTQCRLCHEHGEGNNNAFGPLSCFACHGVTLTDSVPGELPGQFWPSGEPSAVPDFSYANNQKGAHRNHIEAISLQVFGEPASELVKNNSALHPTLTSSEKQILVCLFCHYDPGGYSGTDPVPHFTDANTDNSPLQRVDVKQATGALRYYLKFTTGTHPTYGRTNVTDDTTGGAYDFGASTCANLVCHNQTPTPGTWNAPPAWAGNARCSNLDCHAAATYTNSHPTHVQTAANGGKFYECYECHADNSGNLGHGNGKIDMVWTNAASLEGSIGGDNGFYDKNDPVFGDTDFAYKDGNYTVTCNLVYCHGGDGAALGWGGSDTTPVWDNSAPDSVYCSSCHRANQSDAGNPGQLIATGNHTDHLTADFGPRFALAPGTPQTSCLGTLTTGCHTDYQTTTATHVDGSVQFANIAGSPASSLLGTLAVDAPTADDTDRCSRCHSTLSTTFNIAGPATVTGAGAALAKTNWDNDSYELPCLSCHNAPATAGTVRPDGSPSGGGRDYAPDMLGSDTLGVDGGGKYLGYGAEVSGHNRSLADGAYPVSANPPAARLCTACHDRTGPHVNGSDDTAFPAGNRISTSVNGQTATGPSQVCRNCHTTALATPAIKRNINRHSNAPLTQPPRNEAIFAARECLQCHDPHGMTFNGTGFNIQMVSPHIVVNSAADSGADVVVSGVRFEALEGPNSFNDGLGSDSEDICVVCHENPANPGYSMYDADGQHANLADYSNDERGSNCSTCHTHNRDYPANPTNNTTVDGFMPIECNACHTFPNKDVVGGTHDLSASHDRHIGRPNGQPPLVPNYGAVFACPTCHFQSTHNNRGLDQGQAWAGVTDAMVQVRFDNRAWPTGWNPATTLPGDRTQDSPDFNETTNVCSNLYCHGDDVARFPAADQGGDTTPVWGTASTAACGTCHRAGAGAAAPNPTDPPGDLAHPVHNGTGPGQYGIGCPVCHYATTTDGTSIANVAAHASRTAEVSFNALADPRVVTGVSDYTGDTVVGSGYGDCTSTYCHSKGTDLVPPYDAASAPAQALAWNDDATCWSCHGNGTDSAAPAYAEGSPKANEHPIHTGTDDPATSRNSNGFGCRVCHWPTTQDDASIVDVALHATRSYQVGHSPAAPALATFSYVAGSPGSCNTANCHGGTSGISWGLAGTIGCDVCHAQSGGTPVAADVNNFAWDGAAQSKVGGTASGGEYDTAGHGAKSVACAGCHASAVGHDSTAALTGANPFRLLDNGGAGPGNFTCSSTDASCHDTAPASLVTDHTSANMAAAGYTPQVNSWSFVPKCVDCHDPHGDGANIRMIQRELIEGSAANWVPTVFPPENAALVFTDDTVGIAPSGAWADNVTQSSLCQECHESSDADFTSFKDGTSIYLPPHPPLNRDCSICHRHNSAFAPTGCEGCHNGDGDADGNWDGVGYDPDGAGPDPAAPNVMGDGVNPDGEGGTPKPYDDGAWGFNVNGHGANGTAPNTPSSGGTPLLSGDSKCTNCHDISIPTGTHLDGMLNSAELQINQNANTAHLNASFIGVASPEWDVQLTFDNRCFQSAGCHTASMSHRHSKDADPAAGAVQFGQKGTVANGESIDYPVDSDLSTNASVTAPDFAPCISCHNPHGTQTLDGTYPTNRMLRDERTTALCTKCH